MRQAYTQNFREIPYAIFETDFVVDFNRYYNEVNYFSEIKKKLDVRNKKQARCVVGKIVVKLKHGGFHVSY